MAEVQEAVASLRALGVDVLSPSDPRVVAADQEFLYVASDKLRSRKLVEDRHLEAIRHSDFLWVVCPDGYTGMSTSGEILAAAVLKTPVYSANNALDLTIGDYVENVSSMAEAINRVRSRPRLHGGVDHVLLNPEDLTNTAYELDELREFLLARRGNAASDAEDRLAQVESRIRRQFGLGLSH
ncbi:MAG TPA: hypothetical protein VGB79_12670 [Allosphingosinicella sp.]|jgi:hypothetical protein